MPQVFNVRHLLGFKERQPIMPSGAIYIGRANARYHRPATKWANPFRPKRPTDHETAVAAYERWLRQRPRLMMRCLNCADAISSIGARPCPANGDVLLRLANE
jgi:hypothetical protein